MTKTFNILNEQKYLFKGDLDSFIREGAIDKNSPFYGNYLYLIKLKKFRKDNVFVYSYMQYNILFSETILYYFMNRYVAMNLLREELKQYLIVIDESIANKYTKLQGIYLSDNEVIREIKEKNPDRQDQIFDIYNLLLYVNYSCDINCIVDLLKFDLSKDYYSIMYTITKQLELLNSHCSPELKDGFNKTADTIFNPIDNCLIVCSDLNSFLTKLKTSGVTVNQGPKDLRGIVTKTDSYLSTLDTDLRNTMFYHHRYHYHKQIFSKSFDLIPRHKFSFHNIHMKLGGVRWCSSGVKTFFH